MLNIKKTVLMLMAIMVGCIALYAAPALAHGEKSQAAYLRKIGRASCRERV